MPAPHTSHELQLADTSPNGGGCGCGGCGCGSNTETGSSTGSTIESTATAATKGNEMTTTSYDVTGMTCGHCAKFAIDTYPKLKSEYIDTGKVRFILREFPLDPLAAAGQDHRPHGLVRAQHPRRADELAQGVEGERGELVGPGEPHLGDAVHGAAGDEPIGHALRVAPEVTDR